MKKHLNPCCQHLRDSLCEVLLELKLRSLDQQPTLDLVTYEKDRLSGASHVDLINMLRGQIDQLFFNQHQQSKEEDALETTSRRLILKKDETPSVQCNTSILNRNIPDDDDEDEYATDDCCGLSNVEIPTTRRQSPKKHSHLLAKQPLHQRQQELNTLAETLKRVRRPTESSTHTIVVRETEEDEEEEEEYIDEDESTPSQQIIRPSLENVPLQYEEAIQKLERDIRTHIAFENQMRIHIENLTGKQEEHEGALAQLTQKYEDELSVIKREKRRLDDLLTIREDECTKLKHSIEDLKSTILRQNEEYAAKLRRLEERYERATKDEKRQVMVMDMAGVLKQKAEKRSGSQCSQNEKSGGPKRPQSKGRSQTAQGFVAVEGKVGGVTGTVPMFTSFQGSGTHHHQLSRTAAAGPIPYCPSQQFPEEDLVSTALRQKLQDLQKHQNPLDTQQKIALKKSLVQQHFLASTNLQGTQGRNNVGHTRQQTTTTMTASTNQTQQQQQPSHHKRSKTQLLSIPTEQSARGETNTYCQKHDKENALLTFTKKGNNRPQTGLVTAHGKKGSGSGSRQRPYEEMKYSMVDLTSSMNNQPQKSLMNRMMHSNSQIITQSMLTQHQHNPSAVQQVWNQNTQLIQNLLLQTGRPQSANAVKRPQQQKVNRAII
ncbi:hypothetical protein FGO68_gene2959 [Halteria grandinella]|uniref:Uncharacterized protein n=1 Tax=Halteria grandinella TaxID=5974 RepID=A0A8J8NW62_HALGN|nr:hypothetical protein FGO68_gene2959 [Halteria grandinella]